MKRFLCAILIVLAVAGLTSCGNKGVSVVGEWQEAGADPSALRVYRFYEDGTMRLSGYWYNIEKVSYAGTYVQDGYTLSLTIEGEPEGDLEILPHRDEIWLYEKDANIPLKLIAFKNGEGYDVRPLYGTWQEDGNGDYTYVFGEDGHGTVTYLGQSKPFAYSAKDGYMYLYLTDESENAYGIYRFTAEDGGTTLKITGGTGGDGQVVVLKKK